MNEIEALKIIDDIFFRNFRDEELAALYVASAALEQQVGQKPIEKSLFGVAVPCCPVCENPIMYLSKDSKNNFCPRCGKKLCWGD